MIDIDLLRGVLRDHLPAHIARQRWSGAQETGLTAAEPRVA